MATRMSLWRLNPDGSASSVTEEGLAREEQIESAIESAPELLGMDLLIVGRQTLTPSGPLDLLAIDADGRLVVVENKRDRTPRDVLAQTIDYAAWVATLTFAEVDRIYGEYQPATDANDLGTAFEDHFGEPLEAIADVPLMVICASRLDDATERMIEFLSDAFAVPVNAVLFQPFEGGFIGRTWLRPEVDSQRSSGKRSAASAAKRDQSKQFWDAWLPYGKDVLPDITLPDNGPRAVWLKRSIISGIPAMLQLWIANSDAYAEMQFDDDDPDTNADLLDALAHHRSEIESAMGEELDWRGRGSSGLLTKRTKVVAAKIDIGDRASPTEEGMVALAQSARRLVDAVKPYLADVFESACAEPGASSDPSPPAH